MRRYSCYTGSNISLFSMKYCQECMKKWFANEWSFGSNVFRLAFGIYFLLVGVKKLRMGYPGFAEALVSGDDLIAQELPNVVLYIYGLALPAAELLAGGALLVNRYVKEAYFTIAVIYLSFIFGQMYNGNTGKIGTDYMPSLVALTMGVLCWKKNGGK